MSRRPDKPPTQAWVNRCEDAAFMLDHGEHIERAARRLGVAVSTLSKDMEDYRRYAKSHPDWITTRGTAAGADEVSALRRTG